MNIFPWLKRKKHEPNITDSWEKKDIPLYADLDSLSLCGIRLGEPVEKFSFLGPSDLTESRNKFFVYKEKGLTIVEENGSVGSFFIAVAKDSLHDRYRGEWILRDSRININVDTKCDYIRKHLGEPFNSGSDASSMIYYYHIGMLVLEFLWNRREKLLSVDMYPD